MLFRMFLLIPLMILGVSCEPVQQDLSGADVQIEKSSISDTYPAIDAAISKLNSYATAPSGVVADVYGKLNSGQLTLADVSNAQSPADLGLSAADLSQLLALQANLSNAIAAAGLSSEEFTNYLLAKSNLNKNTDDPVTPCYDALETTLAYETAAFGVCAALTSGTLVGPLACAAAYTASVAIAYASYDACVTTK